MNRKEIAIRNSSIGLLSQIISVVFQFATRSVFVQYLGVEMLGISSTFSSVLNTLSLAELGFQSAIIYNLYKPLAENNTDMINKIVNLLKIIYRTIGFIFIGAGFLCTPFVKFILSNVEINTEVYIIFYIQVANSACSYFMAYKRALLYADKREFMTKITDTFINVVINILKIIVVIKTGNYILYISLTTFQTIVSNLVVHIISRKIYPYIKKTQFDKELFLKIWDNVKNLFFGKIAYYIYSSTDNLVISSLISTVSVGYVVNYTTLISNIKTLANSIFNPIVPIIGSMVAETKSEEKSERICRSYTFVRFLMTCCILVPLITLIQNFIGAWVGNQYLLSELMVMLYGIDMYISFLHGPTLEFVNANGLFRDERNIEIAGAAINLITSVMLAKCIGLQGVLIGTVISQFFFWISRSLLAYKKCFGNDHTKYIKYWITNLIYIAVFALCLFISRTLYGFVNIDVFVLKFIFCACAIELITILIIALFFHRTAEYKWIVNLIKQKLHLGKKGV